LDFDFGTPKSNENFWILILEFQKSNELYDFVPTTIYAQNDMDF